MELKDFLLSILGSGAAIGAGVFLMLEKIAAFNALDAEAKRWVVMLVSGVLGIAAWGVALFLGYIPAPDVWTPNFYAESVWKYGVMTGFVAFTSATLIHGHTALSKNSFEVTLDR